MGVRALGYIGIESNRADDWDRFCQQILGLMPAGAGDGRQRYRVDGQGWRIAIEPGDSEDLAYAGFELADRESLEALDQALKAAGHSPRWDAELAAERGVRALFHCCDPDGLRLEFYVSALDVSHHPFVSPAGVRGFVTGTEGLGHIVLFSRDVEAKLRFYREQLGFSVSDTMTLGPNEITFLHCNARHHTLATAQAPVEQHLNHFMLEVRELDDVGFAQERVIAAGDPITASFGRHNNDEMLSIYVQTPSGFDVEFGYGGRKITRDWATCHYNTASLWGHHRDNMMGSTTPDTLQEGGE